MTKIKICGITTLDDALIAAEAGAHLLGLNFYKASPRYISPELAQNLCDQLREALGEDCPVLVGVFVNATSSEVSAILNQAGLDFGQLSGDESDEVIAELSGRVFKAIRPMTQAMALEDAHYYGKFLPVDDRIPSILLDAYHPRLYGGTGEQASVETALAVKALVPRLMLAGGLTPENVADRIRAILPWGVDVASGVEDKTPGRKDAAKIRAFIDAARTATA